VTAVTEARCDIDHRLRLPRRTQSDRDQPPNPLQPAIQAVHALRSARSPAGCHRRIEERLATLERAAEHLNDRTGAALVAFRSVFEFMDSAGVLHTADEEESLFPGSCRPWSAVSGRTWRAWNTITRRPSHLHRAEGKARTGANLPVRSGRRTGSGGSGSPSSTAATSPRKTRYCRPTPGGA